MFMVLGMITILEFIPITVKIAKEILKNLTWILQKPILFIFHSTIHFYSLFMTWRLTLPQMAMLKTILI